MKDPITLTHETEVSKDLLNTIQTFLNLLETRILLTDTAIQEFLQMYIELFYQYGSRKMLDVATSYIDSNPNMMVSSSAQLIKANYSRIKNYLSEIHYIHIEDTELDLGASEILFPLSVILIVLLNLCMATTRPDLSSITVLISLLAGYLSYINFNNVKSHLLRPLDKLVVFLTQEEM